MREETADEEEEGERSGFKVHADDMLYETRVSRATAALISSCCYYSAAGPLFAVTRVSPPNSPSHTQRVRLTPSFPGICLCVSGA